MPVMLYAQIIIAKRTQADLLTYLVPERIIPYIKLGSLVTVPLRSGKVMGVVVEFKKNIDIKLRSKIKEITQVEKDNQVSEQTIKVFKEISKRYFYSLAEVAHMGLSKQLLKPNIPGKEYRTEVIQGPYEWRCIQYLKILEIYSEALIIFPTHQFANDFKSKLNKNLAKKVTVGTIGDIFTPLASNSVVIIDQGSHIGSTNERRPYLSSEQVASIRCQVERRTLVLGESVVSLNYLREIIAQKIKVTSNIIDSSYLVVAAQKHSKIAESVLQQIGESRTKLIISPSIQGGGAMFCTNCKTLQTCENCSRPVVKTSEESMRCNYCSKQYGNFKCSNCSKELLIELGLRDYSQINIEKIYDESIFSAPLQKSELAVLLGFDKYLSSANFDLTIRLIRFLVELQAVSKKIVIQTNFPDHPFWGNINTQKLKLLLKNELNARKLYKLPPYSTKIELIGIGNFQHLLKWSEQNSQLIEGLGFSVSPIKKLKGSKVVIDLYCDFIASKATLEKLQSLLPQSFQLKICD